jgi:hypothetical protein
MSRLFRNYLVFCIEEENGGWGFEVLFASQSIKGYFLDKIFCTQVGHLVITRNPKLKKVELIHKYKLRQILAITSFQFFPQKTKVKKLQMLKIFKKSANCVSEY